MVRSGYYSFDSLRAEDVLDIINICSIRYNFEKEEFQVINDQKSLEEIAIQYSKILRRAGKLPIAVIPLDACRIKDLTDLCKDDESFFNMAIDIYEKAIENWQINLDDFPPSQYENEKDDADDEPSEAK
jgi:hypothetical protein